MPITLLTGLPGHGKSHEAIRMMRDDYKDRKIYAFNFPKLDYEFLGAEEFDAKDWQNCDAGSILFIDEAWEVFEQRGPHKMPPERVKELARHRHKGLDIVLIAQGYQQIDAHVRSLVEVHKHIVRPFGMSFYNVRTFNGVERFPGDRDARKRAVDVSKRRKYDKRIFPLYKSAEVHTIKRRVPIKLVGSVLVLCGTIFLIYRMIVWGYGFMHRNDGDGIAATQPAGDYSPSSVIRNSGSRSKKMNMKMGDLNYIIARDNYLAEYMAINIPVVEAVPWTAPKYFEVMEPVTFPKPYCAYIEAQNRCFCRSQQGTKMAIEYAVCLDYALNGYFDDTLEDRGSSAGEYPPGHLRVSSRRPRSNPSDNPKWNLVPNG